MGKRLLLVEDEATLARAMARLLRRAGYDVFLAGTCDEAARADGPFSLAVFDVDLPDGDGIELAVQLKAAGKAKRVVFFTGSTSPEVKLRTLTVGPLVLKTSGFPALFATIELMLANQSAKVAGAEETPVGETSDPPPSGVRVPPRKGH